MRLEYTVDSDRVMQVKCEKCGADKEVVVGEYERLVDAATEGGPWQQ